MWALGRFVFSRAQSVVVSRMCCTYFSHVAASTLLDLLYALIDPRLKAS